MSFKNNKYITLSNVGEYDKPSSEPISYISSDPTTLEPDATPEYVDAQVTNIFGTAPASINTLTLNALNELTIAVQNAEESNVITNLAAVVATKQSASGDYSVGDNIRIKLGDSDDLLIYHDGLNSYIKDVGTGGLKIQGRDSVSLQDSATGANYIFCQSAGKVELNYNGSEKLKTTSTGIDVTGGIIATKISLGGSATDSDGQSQSITHDPAIGFMVDDRGGNPREIYHTGNLQFADNIELIDVNPTLNFKAILTACAPEIARNITSSGAGDYPELYDALDTNESGTSYKWGDIDDSGSITSSDMIDFLQHATGQQTHPKITRFLSFINLNTDGSFDGWKQPQLSISGEITVENINLSGSGTWSWIDFTDNNNGPYIAFNTAADEFLIDTSISGDSVILAVGGPIRTNHSYMVGTTTVIETDAKIDANKIKNVPASWAGDDTWRTISDSTSSSSTTVSASSKAVKTAYDIGNHSHPYLPSSGKAEDSDKLDGKEASQFANSDLSNVTSLPATIAATLKGDTGDTGDTGAVGATFSMSGSTLTITPN